MAKSVSLGTGRRFATITAAKQHFAPMLERNELKQPFSGDDLADITALISRLLREDELAASRRAGVFLPDLRA